MRLSANSSKPEAPSTMPAGQVSQFFDERLISQLVARLLGGSLIVTVQVPYGCDEEEGFSSSQVANT